jgi:hypothetical protein
MGIVVDEDVNEASFENEQVRVSEEHPEIRRVENNASASVASISGQPR